MQKSPIKRWTHLDNSSDVTVYCCSEYQLESEALSRCELLRGAAAQQGSGPQCGEDGSFRCVPEGN